MIEIIPNWHPAFVHFPLALLTVVALALLLGLLATNTWRESLETFAHWNLRLGFLFALATLWLGWLAYQSVAHDGPSHAAMTRHRDAALIAVGLWTPLFVASWYRGCWRRGARVLFAIGALAAAAMLARAGWLGAEVVYRHGIGVERLPDAAGEGHDHIHGPEATTHHGGAAEKAPATPAPTSSEDGRHSHGDGDAAGEGAAKPHGHGH